MDKDLQRKKMKGSLLGRAAGETFGRPYRGSHEPLDLLFYEPEPPAGFCHCPLDFQMMWVRLLMAVPEIPLAERDFFAQNWLDHVRNPEEEYGAAPDAVPEAGRAVREPKKQKMPISRTAFPMCM